jgi:hypothetical protein
MNAHSYFCALHRSASGKPRSGAWRRADPASGTARRQSREPTNSAAADQVSRDQGALARSRIAWVTNSVAHRWIKEAGKDRVDKPVANWSRM